MKTYITLLLLIAAISVKAQTTTVTSKDLGDQIVLQRAAFEITHIIVTLNGDTARSMRYNITSVSRDTTAGFQATVMVYDKRGQLLTTNQIAVPGNFFLKWAGFITKLDNYLLKNRLVKQ